MKDTGKEEDGKKKAKLEIKCNDQRRPLQDTVTNMIWKRSFSDKTALIKQRFDELMSQHQKPEKQETSEENYEITTYQMSLNGIRTNE